MTQLQVVGLPEIEYELRTVPIADDSRRGEKVSFVDLISAATQPTNSSSNPSTEALISLAAAFGALLALGKTAIEFLQARIKPSAANTPPADAESAEAIVSLETTEIVLYSRSSWVMMWVVVRNKRWSSS